MSPSIVYDRIYSSRMSLHSCAYLPGKGLPDDLPLARFLPLIAPGMVSGWLKHYATPGNWVIDPFGSTPVLPLEAALAGYKVLVASNNPVLSFITEILAGAPSLPTLQAALSDLSDMRRGSERLEIHLQSLYQTDCAVCGQTNQAEAFLWKRGETQPYGRLYHCTQCGDDGERLITNRDLERLSIPGNLRLHRARAFERVNLGIEALQEGIQDALNTYLARPIYFLNTLINRIEGLSAADPHRRLLTAMTLVICDEANSLWPFPSPRQRPRQLATPAQFRENNLWLALEKSIQQWSSQQQPVKFTLWPELPAEGEAGICLYPGRLKKLLPLPASIQPTAAIGVFPRPNQAFWTLSAIWSGWLWGKEAVVPLKGSLERQRYDWNWHATALANSLAVLGKNTPDHFPLIAFLPEVVPGFLAATVIAGESADFYLKGLALREEQEFAQVLFISGPADPSLKLNISEICRDSIIKNLSERNEPASYLNLFTGCLQSLSSQDALIKGDSHLPAESLSHILPEINKIFTDSSLLIRYESTSSNLELGQYWLSKSPDNKLTLADLIEIEVVHFLQNHPGSLLSEIDEAMCTAFPGVMTPPLDLIRTCLDSYADNSPIAGWHLRANESAASRKKDLIHVEHLLKTMAIHFGYDSVGEKPLLWNDKGGKEIYRFYPIASSIISRFVLGPTTTNPGRCVLVIPGSRSNLLALKLKRDPRLAEAVSKGWVFLKYRFLRQLAERTGLTMSIWEELIETDPPIFDGPVQMSIL